MKLKLKETIQDCNINFLLGSGLSFPYLKTLGNIEALLTDLENATFDEKQKRATNFYVWESRDAADAFFSKELRERVTDLYGVSPRIDFVEIAQIVDNSAP